jgi:hypothetical protein
MTHATVKYGVCYTIHHSRTHRQVTSRGTRHVWQLQGARVSYQQHCRTIRPQSRNAPLGAVAVILLVRYPPHPTQTDLQATHVRTRAAAAGC